MFAGRRELRFTFHYIKHIFSESKVLCYPKHLKYKPEQKKQSRDAIYIYIYIYKFIHPPALRKEILYQGPSSIMIKCHTIDRIFLVFCSKGKKGSLPTVPGFSCRNIDENGDLDSSGVYWIRPAGSLVSFQGYCDKSAVGRKFTDRSNKLIINGN